MKKKILACLLLVSMIAGIFSFAAVAEENAAPADAAASTEDVPNGAG